MSNALSMITLKVQNFFKPLQLLLSIYIIRWLENILAAERAIENRKPIQIYFQKVCLLKDLRTNPSMWWQKQSEKI